jgi:PadR family transcriptional regulator, regulatory protein PadR
MAQQNYLGEFEEIVLLAILRLRDTAYGVSIRQLIEEETNRLTSIGAIYTTLERLEQKGYVRSHQGEATPERGGRAKKYFHVTGSGAVALNEAMEARRKLMSGLDDEWVTT